MIHPLRAGVTASTITVGLITATALAAAAHADTGNTSTLVPNNNRLNDGVISNIYTAQHHAGCTHDVKSLPQLQQAAQRQTHDVLTNHDLDGDIGSDGSTPQDRANAAGFEGKVSETVAINPALAINNMDVITQWYNNPAYLATMQDCANNVVGVWSENSLDRSVVVAVYGQQAPTPPTLPAGTSAADAALAQADSPTPPGGIPDYDASDELQYGLSWLPWILRGVYPPPANPPQ
ncbi:MAG: hypothetical protein QOC62_4732 [Mycobacterium sp.]|jgi:hypothetical protein|nr:hypothetical protein [Mycobacterium sp.]MDT5370301.1 hypothetical protein [Mycobacterium sp.]